MKVILLEDVKALGKAGEIVNVSVDKSALTDGKEDISKVAPICIDPFNHSYHVIGEKVGMAWGSGKSLM